MAVVRTILRFLDPKHSLSAWLSTDTCILETYLHLKQALPLGRVLDVPDPASDGVCAIIVVKEE